MHAVPLNAILELYAFWVTCENTTSILRRNKDENIYDVDFTSKNDVKIRSIPVVTLFRPILDVETSDARRVIDACRLD